MHQVSTLETLSANDFFKIILHTDSPIKSFPAADEFLQVHKHRAHLHVSSLYLDTPKWACFQKQQRTAANCNLTL